MADMQAYRNIYKDYKVYKLPLKAPTNEVRDSKRNFELKLAQAIETNSKSFHASVRSMQNVRDKVGPHVRIMLGNNYTNTVICNGR